MLKKYFPLPLFIILSIFALNAHALLNSHEEAEELLLLMGYDKQKNLDLDKILELQSQLKPEMAAYKEPMREFFQKYVSYETLKPQLIKMYAEAFSAKELNELKMFYISPTGKKALSIIPAITEKTSRLVQNQLRAHANELNQMIKEYVRNNPNEILKSESQQLIRKLINKLNVDKLLYSLAYTHLKSSHLYTAMTNKIGEESTEKIIQEELFKATPEYQDWWNNQLASSIEKTIEKKKINDLAVNGKSSIFAEEFDNQLSDMIMTVVTKDGELMSELTTKVMNAAFYERMN